MEYCNELQHYGVKGMKWGVRRDKEWASSPHQPSSRRSSALAGAYLATGSKRLAKKLDKSNERDAERWKKAKEKYPEEAKLGKARTKAISDIEDKNITAIQKYDSKISKEYSKLVASAKENKPFDESRLETLLTDRYNYNKISDYVTDRIGKMSMDELNSLNDRSVENSVSKYIDRLDRMRSNI